MNLGWLGQEKLLERKSYLAPVEILGFSALLFLPGLGARDFWAPGEPIYGEVIRGMYERSDWLVPMLNGQIYADKPVLYFWLALIVAKIGGGVTEWVARLPAAFGGLGLALATYQFGKVFYDRQTGVLSALVLATSSRMLWESRFLRLDTVLSFFLFGGFYFFLVAFTKRGSAKNYLIAYFCFAMATLTKGPIGIVLPGFAILGMILISGRRKEIKDLRLVAGALVVAAVIVPWLLLLHLSGNDQWLNDFIWVHNVQNYALEPLGHVQPFYYYFWNLPLDFLPWTLLIPGALIFYYPWRAKLQYIPSLGLACWFGSILVFFSLSKSKISYYLLPLLPSLALLAGCYFHALITAGEHQGAHWQWTAKFLYLLACLFGLMGMALPFAAFKIEPALFSWALLAAVVFIAGSLGMWIFLRRRQVGYFLSGVLVVLLATSLIASARVFPYLDKYKSPRPIGEAIRSRLPADAAVYVFKSKMADFNYYARRALIPVVASANELKLAPPYREAYLIINQKDLNQLKTNFTLQSVTEHGIGERKWYLLKFF